MAGECKPCAWYWKPQGCRFLDFYRGWMTGVFFVDPRSQQGALRVSCCFFKTRLWVTICYNTVSPIISFFIVEFFFDTVDP